MKDQHVSPMQVDVLTSDMKFLVSRNFISLIYTKSTVKLLQFSFLQNTKYIQSITDFRNLQYIH